MLKILVGVLLFIAGNSAFAGGTVDYTCKMEGVKLDIEGHSVDSAELTISMIAELDLRVNTPELKSPLTRVSSTCKNAFKNSDWNRFICTVGNQAVIVTTDDISKSCLIKSPFSND